MRPTKTKQKKLKRNSIKTTIVTIKIMILTAMIR